MSFVCEKRGAHFDLLAILRVTFQFVAIAFIASPSWQSCDFFQILECLHHLAEWLPRLVKWLAKNGVGNRVNPRTN